MENMNMVIHHIDMEECITTIGEKQIIIDIEDIVHHIIDINLIIHDTIIAAITIIDNMVIIIIN
jgi:hypothetical protein